MASLVVRSERVVLPDATRPATIQVSDGRITAVGSHGDLPAGVPLIDAGNLIVMPGVVDSHVHVNDPGRTLWEGFEHATRAAAAGGVTTLVDMPLNSVPATTTVDGLERKRSAADRRIHIDVGFWGGVVPFNVADLEPLAEAGVLGFKCFLSPSGVEEFQHVTEADLRKAMPVIAGLRLPLLVHAELPALLVEPKGDARAYDTWLRSRPPAAEQAAIELLGRLSREYGAHVHIVHLAAVEPLPAIRQLRRDGVQLTVETCPHYLTFAAEDITDGATAWKCAPPIRHGLNREALWQALADGDIDLLATDHSPAPASLKSVDQGDFIKAWGGIASLQLGLAAIWTQAAARGFSINDVVRWMSFAPATLAGLTAKGRIVAGADADLVVFDPEAVWTVDPAKLHHRHPLTPYAGMTLRGAVRKTLLRGETVFNDGELTPGASGRMIASRS
ncbi:MAG: allantoinase AllB [Vicinamibacterales bacterium]